MADDETYSQAASDGIWATSQAAGNLAVSNRNAMTAPGSVPAALGTDEQPRPPAPQVNPEHYASGHTVDGGEPPAAPAWQPPGRDWPGAP